MKRYIRLLLPVMLMYTIVYLMKQYGLFGSLEYALELSGGVKEPLIIQRLPPYPPCIKRQ